MTQQLSDTSARSKSPALLVEHTASTNPQQDRSDRRLRLVRVLAPLAVTACSAALLSAVVATPAVAGVTATPVYVPTVNASDTMTRTVSGGFGTANMGGSYTTLPATNFSVSNGAGHISPIASGTNVTATLSGSPGADEQLQSTFSLPSLPAYGTGIYYQLQFRLQSNGDAYRVQVKVAPDGAMTLGFGHMRNNALSAVGPWLVVPQRATAGTTLVLQGLVAGSTSVDLRARAWISGTAAPGWQLTAADISPTRLTTAGSIGNRVLNSASTSATAVTVAGLTGWSLAPPPPPGPVQPGPTNTGVPAGTVLTQYNGNLVVTTPGAVYDALDIHGFVTIKAANVTIKRSIVRGGVATTGNPGLVTDTDVAGTNFQLTDSELVPQYPSVYIDGVRGANYTVTRSNIHGTVDTAKVIGNNATIQNSWLHDTVYYAYDPAQGGPSHNDGVQVLNGTKIRILNNTITGADNAGLQVTQGNGVVSDLWFNGNWADGGGCTVNINNTPLASMNAVTVNDNRFGHATRNANCPIIVTKAVALTALRNVYDDTGAVAVVRYG